MIVGEAPGEREDESHQAFVGPAGQLLTRVLEKAGLSREECYITNVAKCRPPSNRAPERSEIKTCVANYLSKEVAWVQPDYILLLGNSALQGVVGRSGITKHRGSSFPIGEATGFAAFHPAYALRNPKHLPALEADIQRFARLVRGGDAPTGPTRIVIVRDTVKLKWLIRQLRRAPIVSYDIETTGLEEWREGARIVSISFTWKEGLSAVVPLHHARSPWTSPERILGLLKHCLERADARYVAHNGKFDCRWLAANGIFVPQGHDTMLSAHLLDENRLKGLKPLSQILLGADAYDVGDDIRDAYNMPLRRLCIYNGKDTDYPLRLYFRFREELKKEPRLARVFTKLMMPASNVLTKVELGGVWLDPERLEQRQIEAEAKVNKLVKYMGKHGAVGVNFNSPQQVAKWLFDDLGLPIIEETPKGAPSTRESVILELAEQAPPVKVLLKYRTWTKYLSTYIRPWIANRDKHSRFHPTYKLFGTVTGRLSGDFQQVPRNAFIRSIVGAPPGWQFMEADYSQIELRLAAMLANERRLLRVFALGGDPHLNTAVDISGLTPSQVQASDASGRTEYRKKAKGVNFGLLYSMYWPSLPAYVKENYDVVITDGEAERFYKAWHAAYPAFRVWHDRQRRLVHRYHRVHSPIGRVRHLPDILSSDASVRKEAERQAINSPVQSLASDLMLLAMIELDAKLDPRVARIVMTVHDQIGFQVRDDYVGETVPIIRETMEDMSIVKRKFDCDITVPIAVEIKVGQHWGEGRVVE